MLAPAYFLEQHGNFEYRCYRAIHGENGTFCGKDLTIDLRVIHFFLKIIYR